MVKPRNAIPSTSTSDVEAIQPEWAPVVCRPGTCLVTLSSSAADVSHTAYVSRQLLPDVGRKYSTLT